MTLKTFRMVGTFTLGLVLIVLGMIGARWSPSGVQMATLTIVGLEVMGVITFSIAWRDLDKKPLNPFWAATQTWMARELHDPTTPEMDFLVKQLEDGAITSEGRARIKELAQIYTTGTGPEITPSKRVIYGMLAVVMDQTVIERAGDN